MDTGQKTESIFQLVEDIVKNSVYLPEFQRDFVWDIEKTLDLFDSFARDIFVGSLIYGVPSFEITVRALDQRPRSGKGSRARLTLHNFTREQIEKAVKINSFRLLLDGQQRATSICRAMLGIDPVFFVARTEEELEPEVRSKPAGHRQLEETLSEFSSEPSQGRVCVKLHDVYRILKGDFTREKEKADLFLASNKMPHLTPDNVEASEEFVTYLSQLQNLANLCRQEKLVAYYLLDTDEEKFALFFERSNSKGIQLNFIDILAAKLYAGFNLRARVEEFEEQNPGLELNREVLVRAISYKVSDGKEIGRSFILSTLSHPHFTKNWDHFAAVYKSVHDFLRTSRLLIHPTWMPYENMVLPLMAFGSAIPRQDFSQISSDQSKFLRVWYWLAIFSRRYSSAAQTYAVEDAQALQRAAGGDFTSIIAILQKMQPVVREIDDLFIVYRKYDAVYKGVLNLVNYSTGGYQNFENGNPVSLASTLEDHHIFPNDYLRKNWAAVHENLDSEIAIDCVVNRTLIPKLTNIKVSNKPPSKYLGELKALNSNLSSALASHAITDDLLTSEFDKSYDRFLDDRATKILNAMKLHVLDLRTELLKSHAPS